MYRDVEQLEILTKDDILDFFITHFRPDSPHRAKSSVHLVAQASDEVIAAKTEPAEQRENLATSLSLLFSQLGITADAKALSTQLEKVDLAKGDVESIKTAVGDYLGKAAGLAVEQVQAIMDQAQTVLPQLLPTLGIKTQTSGAEVTPDQPTNGEAKKANKPVYIEDIKTFQMNLALSQGPRAVRDLSEFEELEAKL